MVRTHSRKYAPRCGDPLRDLKHANTTSTPAQLLTASLLSGGLLIHMEEKKLRWAPNYCVSARSMSSPTTEENGVAHSAAAQTCIPVCGRARSSEMVRRRSRSKWSCCSVRRLSSRGASGLRERLRPSDERDGRGLPIETASPYDQALRERAALTHAPWLCVRRIVHDSTGPPTSLSLSAHSPSAYGAVRGIALRRLFGNDIRFVFRFNQLVFAQIGSISYRNS